MHGPTPEQKRRIEKAKTELSEFWYVDFNTKEIRHKESSRLQKFIEIFWKKRNSVGELYWWIKYRFAKEDAMPFHFPIQSDNMPIEGFPMKYELKGGWTIPSNDLKYLTKGPLASEGLSKVLVQHALGWKRVVLLIKQYGPILTGLIAIVGTIVRYWPELLKLLSLIQE
jgi:hypothetical protein